MKDQHMEEDEVNFIKPSKQQTPLHKHIQGMKEAMSHHFEDSRTYKAISGCIDNAESLLPEEKQMVLDAFYAGDQRDCDRPTSFSQLCEQYFNETFLVNSNLKS